MNLSTERYNIVWYFYYLRNLKIKYSKILLNNFLYFFVFIGF